MKKMLKTLVLLLSFSFCSDNLYFDGTYRYAPPAIYKTWYAETRQCAGKLAITRRSFTSLDFYRLDTVSIEINGQRAIAFEKQGSIFITNNYLMDKRVVKHEMLHAITDIDGHPSIFYQCHLMHGQSGENK